MVPYWDQHLQNHHQDSGWDVAVGIAVLLLVVALLVFALWMLFLAWRQMSGEEAIKVLKKRYAAGEIGTKEYQKKLRVLTEKSPP